MTVGCVVVAAGRGDRLGAGPKAFVLLDGVPLVTWACRAAADGGADVVVVVLPSGSLHDERLDDVRSGLPADVVRVEGGPSRQASVDRGLAALPPAVEVVLVHDAARALVPASVFAAVVAAVRAGHAAVVPAVPVTDTLRLVDPVAGEVVVHRDRLVAVQTPQGFDRATLVRAHREAPTGDATDDAGLVERLGAAVLVVPGHEEGFKVTRPLDLLLAGAVLRARVAS